MGSLIPTAASSYTICRHVFTTSILGRSSVGTAVNLQKYFKMCEYEYECVCVCVCERERVCCRSVCI